MKRDTAPYRPPSEHYENFPVASWLCPPHLRRPISAIYWFARTADDIADEGSADARLRLSELARYRADLLAVAGGQTASAHWPQVFEPLSRMITRYRLPVPLLTDLLDAFEQDIRYTAQGRRYQDDTELHEYCRRSANPVGRLLLHLYGVQEPEALASSDRICTALQLINFWQDLRTDVRRARWYPSVEKMRLHGVREADLLHDGDCDAASRMLARYACEAATMMQHGAHLALHLPGRAGWELRLVVQGGLRILEKMRHMNHATWRDRPTVGKADLPVLLWRAWRMPATSVQLLPA